MNLLRERYRLDLVELQATCAANYARLMRLLPDMREHVGTRRVALSQGEHLLGDDGEGTVDSSHPNDLGFMRQADVFAKVLKPLLR